MKNVLLFLCLYLSLTLSVSAQKNYTFKGEEFTLSLKQQYEVENHICDYQTFHFPIADFQAFLQKKVRGTAGAECEIQWSEDLLWSVELQENDLRSADFIRSRTGAEGPIDARSLPPNINYQGQLQGRPDNWLRWTVSGDFFTGLSIIDGKKYRIEPLANLLTDEDLEGVYILHSTSQRGCLPELVKTCTAPEIATQPSSVEASKRQTTDPPQRYLELAADVDYEFYQDYDMDIAQVEQTIQARINEIDGVYQDQFNMAVILVYLNIWTTPGDPYVGNHNTLYNDVMFHWKNNNPCIHRDVVHLFSGREGLAASGGVNPPGVRSICGAHDITDAQWFPNQLNVYACGWSRNVRDFDSWEIAAHELGHNFGATHNCENYLMCHNTGDCQCAVDVAKFHSSNVIKINDYLNGINGAYSHLGPFPNDICLTEPDPEDLANNVLVKQEREQMALAELPGPTVLPNANGATYNYGQANFNTIPQFTIEAGGYLRVNDAATTSYGSGPFASQVDYTANTLRCGSYITVKDGGYFILGNDDGAVNLGNRATVRLREHGTIRVKKGGTLRLARGSKLIIEQGAELYIEEGANIDLWWSESTIQVQGTLRMTGQFNFDGSGFFQFDETHTMYLPNDGFRLHGQGDRFLRLNKNTDWRIGDKALDLKNGTVEYADNTRISVGENGSVLAEQVDFQTWDNGINNFGFYASGCDALDFRFCGFEGLAVGIQATEVEANAVLRTFYCTFEDCDVGVFAYDYPQVELQNTSFTGTPTNFAAVLAERIDLLGLVSCQISDYSSGDLPSGALNLREIGKATLTGTELLNNEVGASLFQVLDFELWGGKVSGSELGIYLSPGEIEVNRTKVALRSGATIDNNETGILVEKGGIDNDGAYGTVLMDCATLEDNGVGIKGEDVVLSIDAYVHCNCSDPAQINPNTFLKDEQSIFGPLLFDICYQDLAGQLNFIAAQGNYWGGGVPQADDDYRFRINLSDGPCAGPNDLFVLTGNVVSTAPSGCNNGDGPDRPRGGDRASEPEELMTELMVFPNPVSTTCRVVTNWPVFEWRVYNTMGQQVGSGQAREALELEVADWPSGLYWIEVLNPVNGEKASESMIVH